MKKEYIEEFDIFRGVSALLIVLYHYTTRYNEVIGHQGHFPINLPWGYMGVSVFFFLSGFLAFMNLRDEDNLFSFGYRRMVRLYPTYWAALILTIISLILLLPDRVPTIHTILINITMLQSFFKVESVDGVYWTLSIELIFYVIIGCVLFIKQKKNINSICLIWISLSILLTIATGNNGNKAFKLLSVLLISNYSHMFVCGIVFYQLYTKKKTIILYIIIGLCLVNHFINHGIQYSIFFVIFLLMVYIIIKRKNNSKYISKFKTYEIIICLRKQITFIAKISYPLYLVHQLIGFGIIKMIEKTGVTNEIIIIIPILFSVGLAYFLHIFIEIPAAKSLLKIIHLGGKNV